MDKLITIIENNLNMLNDNLKGMYICANNIIETCELPFGNSSIRTNYKGKKELNNTIKNFTRIKKQLKNLIQEN